jgi:hypothetical protein
MTKAKIVSAALSATTALLSIAPVTLASSVEVSGNGADSESTANVEIVRSVNILQRNNADVDNNVDASANTGGNEANDNTGGDVSIDTGNAKTTLAISTLANSNKQSSSCCNDDLSISAKISGNGSDSRNEINLNLTKEFNLTEDNNLDIDNRLELSADTGNNKAEGNTDGNVEINTGNALIELVLTNKGNSNEAVCECDEDEDKPGKDKEVPGPGVAKVIPAAAAPAGQTLPVTGFDFQWILAGSALVTSAGVALKKGSRKLEELLG